MPPINTLAVVGMLTIGLLVGIGIGVVARLVFGRWLE